MSELLSGCVGGWVGELVCGGWWVGGGWVSEWLSE